MSPLTENALIYDDNCPLCSAYTRAFVKGGLLKKEGRISFSEVNMQQFCIDWNKARHEIPLINLQTGEVSYGVDALVNILSQKWRWLNPLLEVKLVSRFIKWQYKLISYNRKIIAASKPLKDNSFDCTPDYSFYWRIVLIIITYSLSDYMFFKVATLLFNANHFDISALNVMYWMFIPLTAIVFVEKKKATDIIAHAGVLAVVTGLLLLCAVTLLKYFLAPQFIIYLILFTIAGFIVMQVYKRIECIQLTLYS